MRFRTPSLAPAATMELVGMVDVIFLLVIFWMVVTALGGPVVDAAVRPPVSGQARRADRPATVVVHLRSAGEVTVAGRPVGRAELVDTVSAMPPGPVVLRADGRASAVETARVLERLGRTGRHVSLSVQRVEARP